jgi:hypothetical protein
MYEKMEEEIETLTQQIAEQATSVPTCNCSSRIPEWRPY